MSTGCVHSWINTLAIASVADDDLLSFAISSFGSSFQSIVVSVHWRKRICWVIKNEFVVTQVGFLHDSIGGLLEVIQKLPVLLIVFGRIFDLPIWERVGDRVVQSTPSQLVAQVSLLKSCDSPGKKITIYNIMFKDTI
jgi:hypothetical protein